MNKDNRLPLALFFLRASVFLVMFMWTLDKFLNPEHSAAVFKSFYFIGGIGNNLSYIIGAVEIVIITGFLLGLLKKWTYGTVLLLHAISTLSTFKQYFSPFENPNLLFFAAWPMLAACFTLYCMRDQDTLFALQ